MPHRGPSFSGRFLRFRDDLRVCVSLSKAKAENSLGSILRCERLLYPQYYWRWPIVPMAGEIDVVNDDEIAAYGAALAKMGVTEGHFYADGAGVPVANLAAMKAL